MMSIYIDESNINKTLRHELYPIALFPRTWKVKSERMEKWEDIKNLVFPCVFGWRDGKVGG